MKIQGCRPTKPRNWDENLLRVHLNHLTLGWDLHLHTNPPDHAGFVLSEN